MSTRVRLLVLDAYAPEGRRAVREAGGTEAGELYSGLLKRLQPDASVEVAYPADADEVLPTGRALGDYDGVVWTGSSLTIHEAEDRRVRRQVELARALYRERVPSFGSCWAAQLAVVAAGGRCAANPKGREFGVSREIRLADAGRSHPMYRDKPPAFDAFTSHVDHVVALPAQAALLAENEWSPVQAVAVESLGGRFWAVQYHPEYDLHEVASLCRIRREELVSQGTFENLEAADRAIEAMEALHADPAREDLMRELGVDSTLLDAEQRSLEVRNWLEHEVHGRS